MAPFRVRPTESDLGSISSLDDALPSPRPSVESPPACAPSSSHERPHRKKTGSGHRNRWTREETEALVRGCNSFAIGQWKAIRDSDPLLAMRSPGDLKDRFRTYFPDAYRQHYPNARTHISSRVRSLDAMGNPLFGQNAVRKERKQFSSEEDEALKRGYIKHGTAWSSIQKDPILATRKATDLRDRFRNAFPDLYAASGYKPRPRKPAGSDTLGLFSSHPVQQHGTLAAIDVPLYSGHPSHPFGPLRSVQYQFPSLDFLKTHGANAFEDYSLLLSDPSPLVDKEPIPLNLSSLQAVSPPGLLSNTPRMNLTPRPNDTTPRPAALHNSNPSNQDSGPCRPLKRALHKTRSSLDLSQFSNMNLVEPKVYPPPLLAPSLPPETSPGAPSLHNLFTGSTPDLLGGCMRPVSTTTALLSPATAPESLDGTSHWMDGLDLTAQTYPGGLDLTGFSNIMCNSDALSSASSLISTNHSPDISEDRVVYTGDMPRLSQPESNCFCTIHSPTCEHVSSNDILGLTAQQLSPQPHGQSLGITLCPSPTCKQLLDQSISSGIFAEVLEDMQRY